MPHACQGVLFGIPYNGILENEKYVEHKYYVLDKEEMETYIMYLMFLSLELTFRNPLL